MSHPCDLYCCVFLFFVSLCHHNCQQSTTLALFDIQLYLTSCSAFLAIFLGRGEACHPCRGFARASAGDSTTQLSRFWNSQPDNPKHPKNAGSLLACLHQGETNLSNVQVPLLPTIQSERVSVISLRHLQNQQSGRLVHQFRPYLMDKRITLQTRPSLCCNPPVCR